MKKLEVVSCEDFSKVLHRILTDLDLKLVFLTHAMPSLKRKVRNVLQTWRSWHTFEFWKCTILCWFIKLLPIWVRVVYLNIGAWTLFLLTLIPSGHGSSSRTLLLKKYSEVRLASQGSDRVQDVYLSICFLAFIRSSECHVAQGHLPGVAGSPWVLRAEQKPKWERRLRGNLGNLQESRNRWV